MSIIQICMAIEFRSAYCYDPSSYLSVSFSCNNNFSSSFSTNGRCKWNPLFSKQTITDFSTQPKTDRNMFLNKEMGSRFFTLMCIPGDSYTSIWLNLTKISPFITVFENYHIHLNRIKTIYTTKVKPRGATGVLY